MVSVLGPPPSKDMHINEGPPAFLGAGLADLGTQFLKALLTEWQSANVPGRRRAWNNGKVPMNRKNGKVPMCLAETSLALG